MTCRSCEITTLKALTTFNNREETIEFLINHDSVPCNIRCNSCNQICMLNTETLFWQCRRKQKKTVNKKVTVKTCNFKQSLRSNSWFQNSNLTLEQSCSIISQYLLLNPPHEQYLIHEFDISSTTYCDWAAYIREVCEFWAFQNCSKKIGGYNKVVEIDEAKFGKRKYNRGRIIEGQWLFGGFERDSKLFFMEPVENRKKETLLEVIKNKIKPGTTIISDCWKAYDCLEDEGKY